MGYTENIKSIMQWGNSFERQGNFPLDRTDLHISYEDAVLYAKGDASDSRKLGKLAYIGQTITVWGLNEKGKEGVWVYSLVPSNKEGFLADLKPVGSTTTETAETYSAAVTLSEGLVVGQLILVAAEETIEEQTYKAGFYIVNAPGSISALDTSTGSSDEIGAITNRVSALEGNRVLNSDFEEYKGTVTTSLDAKVDDSEFTTYKEEITGALNEKATTADLSTLETKVDGDIKVLTDLIDDYSGTLGDVDDRLGDLEAFVEAHESIPESDIEALFPQSTTE